MVHLLGMRFVTEPVSQILNEHIIAEALIDGRLVTESQLCLGILRHTLRNRTVQLADMDDGAMVNIRDGFAQDFVGEGSCVAFAKKKETEHVCDRVAFFPLEIDVRDAAGHAFDVDKDGRDGVCNHRAARAE